MTSINPDAHDSGSLAYVRAGVNSARKGWLTKASVVNALPLEGVEAWLARMRRRP
jgi:DNA polymerase (family 10)